MQSLKVLFPSLQQAVVCEEMHEDETPHLHIYMSLTERIYVEHSLLDKIVDKHGDYQSCRNINNVLRYVTKEKNYVEFGINVEAKLASQLKKSGYSYNKLAGDLIAGKKITDLVTLEPGFLFQNLKKVQEFVHFLEISKEQELKPYFGLVVPPIRKLNDYDVANWVNTNIKHKRKIRQPHLWIYGETSTGKSRLRRHLEKRVKTFIPPLDEQWDTGFSDDCELIVYDDFGGQRTLNYMNRITDGSKIAISQKGALPVYKTQNQPIIVISNVHPCNIYVKAAEQNPSNFNALLSRFQFVDLKEKRLQLEWKTQLEDINPEPLKKRKIIKTKK